jgi:chromosomal replication initiator protein
MIAVYLTRKHTGLSYPDIGRAFGGRDHTTALHAWQRIGFRVQSDEAVQRAVAAIETALGK